MNNDDVLKKINELYGEGKSVKHTFEESKLPIVSSPYSNRISNIEFTNWKSKCISFLEKILNESDYRLCSFKNHLEENIYSNVDKGLGLLQSVIDEIEDGTFNFKNVEVQNHDEIIENIFEKFSRVANQLTKRHDGRDTLKITDEYDVQDLLHALLLLYFDTAQDEEYTPSHGAKSTRIDFIIKDIKIAIETKYASEKLKDKKLSDEIILDKGRYFSHPDCEKLFFFVYDENNNIDNPFVIERDLSEKRGNYEVKVFIWPKL